MSSGESQPFLAAKRETNRVNSVTPFGKNRRTPEDSSELEREQLRFFLSHGDLATLLSTLNPSLAWLPFLSEAKLVQNDRQLTGWIERNFQDAQAVKDVVANLRFFGAEAADILEFRLNRQADTLEPLLLKSWRLIIRHMRTARRGLLRNDWYEIAPRLRRGEFSPGLMESLVEVLCPQLRVGKRLSLADEDTNDSALPTQVSDLMSIDYEVDEGLTAEEILGAWPKRVPSEVFGSLLRRLTEALDATLEDATDVGVEGEKFGASDTDVPSVAPHEQNKFRTGFQVIVSVMAGLWERLAVPPGVEAIRFVEDWSRREYRLMRRLALFAAANTVVPGELAGSVLLSVPPGEIFLTSATVEVIRLVRARWGDLPSSTRELFLARLRAGPPREWYRADSDIDKLLDRCRFDMLGELERAGIALDHDSSVVLADVRARWRGWQLRPANQAGFHIWSEGARAITGDAGTLAQVPEENLVDQAEDLAETSGFLDGDAWQALCLSEPDRAVHGLQAAARKNEWPADLWRTLLWAQKEYAELATERCIGELLLAWPADTFVGIAPAVSWWLDQHAKTLSEEVLWPLWDKVARAVLAERKGAVHA
jgi:hypothetical protein